MASAFAVLCSPCLFAKESRPEFLTQGNYRHKMHLICFLCKFFSSSWFRPEDAERGYEACRGKMFLGAEMDLQYHTQGYWNSSLLILESQFWTNKIISHHTYIPLNNLNCWPPRPCWCYVWVCWSPILHPWATAVFLACSRYFIGSYLIYLIWFVASPFMALHLGSASKPERKSLLKLHALLLSEKVISVLLLISR